MCLTCTAFLVEHIPVAPSAVAPSAHHSACMHAIGWYLMSDACRARTGQPPTPQILEHIEEAQQPDDDDLEYLYVRGNSRPPSGRTSHTRPARPTSASSFIQEDNSPQAHVDDWDAGYMQPSRHPQRPARHEYYERSGNGGSPAGAGVYQDHAYHDERENVYAATSGISLAPYYLDGARAAFECDGGAQQHPGDVRTSDRRRSRDRRRPAWDDSTASIQRPASPPGPAALSASTWEGAGGSGMAGAPHLRLRGSFQTPGRDGQALGRCASADVHRSRFSGRASVDRHARGSGGGHPMPQSAQVWGFVDGNSGRPRPHTAAAGPRPDLGYGIPSARAAWQTASRSYYPVLEQDHDTGIPYTGSVPPARPSNHAQLQRPQSAGPADGSNARSLAPVRPMRPHTAMPRAYSAAYTQVAPAQQQHVDRRPLAREARSIVDREPSYSERMNVARSLYSQQLNGLLRDANQLAAALGSRRRYIAATRGFHSRQARTVQGSMEGYVEAHPVSVRVFSAF